MKKGEIIKKYPKVVKVRNERATIIDIEGSRYVLDMKNMAKGQGQ